MKTERLALAMTAETKDMAAGHDPDLTAIRNLLAKSRHEEAEPASGRDLARDMHRNADRLRARAPEQAASRNGRPPVEPRQRSAASEAEPTPKPASPGFGARIKQAGLRKMRSYQPRTKVVLGTSFVLLLFLHPGATIGWLLFALIFLVALYLIVGEDRFWRAVAAVHGRYARISPGGARRLKVRAQLAARKWNRWVLVLPQGLADSLQAPDVRALVMAEARHDAVLTERLSRLDRDSAS
jgi:hypothetical protein